MYTYEASSLARQLMNNHGLGHWVFSFDRAKKRAGQCRYSSKTISLSENYVHRNTELDVRNTILHEIAHALVGPGHGHGHVWKQMAIKVGAQPVRCYGEHIDMPKGRYQAKCNGCNREFHLHRRLKVMKGRYCRKCGPVKGLLHWSVNCISISS